MNITTFPKATFNYTGTGVGIVGAPGAGALAPMFFDNYITYLIYQYYMTFHRKVPNSEMSLKVATSKYACAFTTATSLYLRSVANRSIIWSFALLHVCLFHEVTVTVISMVPRSFPAGLCSSVHHIFPGE